MRLAKTICTVTAAAIALWAESPFGIFEPQPRVVVEGRDPMLAVRASGAISLMKVDKGDLWVHTSFDGGDSFEPGVRVNDSPGEVSSHGESSPQLQVRTRSEFYCLWQTRRGDGERPVLRFARSLNWSESFSKAIDVIASPSQSFFTMNVLSTGVIHVAWLDGRDREGRAGASALYVTRSANKGLSFGNPVRVALNACPCCRPAITFAGERGVYIAWRSVLDGNVRDILVAASADEGSTWSTPVRVAGDNWVLNGCPHSGPALATVGKRLFIAWHTVRDRRPVLSLAYSDDGAGTFSRPIPASEGVLDANHPFLNSIGDRLALVFQGRTAGRAQGWAPLSVYYREVDAEARLTRLQTVEYAGGSVSYPVLAFEQPERLYVAWTVTTKDGKAVVLSRGRRDAPRHRR